MPSHRPPFKRLADQRPHLFRTNLRDVSARLLKQYDSERAANIDNFESGVPVENYFRQELSKLLNDPYGADVAHVVDREQYTCGECDCVIYDKRLSPLLRPPPTPDTRRKHLAYEATYGIVEVKQKLTLGALGADNALLDEPKGSLWDACQKIFAYKELTRRPPERLIWGTNLPIGLAVFFETDLDVSAKDVQDAVLTEFAAINALVPAEAQVDGIYVLNRFSILWSILSEPETPVFLTLHHSAEAPRPLWVSLAMSGEDTLCKMYQHLWSLLGRTQLVPPDLLNDYGGIEASRTSGLRTLACSPGAARELADIEKHLGRPQ